MPSLSIRSGQRLHLVVDTQHFFLGSLATLALPAFFEALLEPTTRTLHET